MIRFRLGTFPVRVHPALVAMLALSAIGGNLWDAASLILSLIAHEGSHALMARLMHIRVVEMELMPFGGAARLENAWGIRPGQMALVALAGPCANALVLAGCFLCHRAGWIALPWLSPLVSGNAMLLGFNLLPALPLDGGRILCGLIGRRIGQARAARVGVMLGHGLALALVALMVHRLLATGQLNLTLVMTAAFIVASGPRERMAARGGGLLSLIDRQDELALEGALPVRWLAASADAPLGSTIARFTPRSLHRVAVYDQDLGLSGVLEEGALLRAALKDSSAPLKSLLRETA